MMMGLLLLTVVLCYVGGVPLSALVFIPAFIWCAWFDHRH